MISSEDAKIKRSCNGCTKCCDGWLTCNIYGHEVKPGRPCYFLKNSSCSIYETRPEQPCRKFECLWLSQPDIVPEEFWPKQSNTIIISRHTDKGNPYISLVDAGGPLSVEMLDWAVQMVQFGRTESVLYKVNEVSKFLSSNKSFVEEMMGVNGES